MAPKNGPITSCLTKHSHHYYLAMFSRKQWNILALMSTTFIDFIGLGPCQWWNLTDLKSLLTAGLLLPLSLYTTCLPRILPALWFCRLPHKNNQSIIGQWNNTSTAWWQKNNAIRHPLGSYGCIEMYRLQYSAHTKYFWNLTLTSQTSYILVK